MQAKDSLNDVAILLNRILNEKGLEGFEGKFIEEGTESDLNAKCVNLGLDHPTFVKGKCCRVVLREEQLPWGGESGPKGGFI